MIGAGDANARTGVTGQGIVGVLIVTELAITRAIDTFSVIRAVLLVAGIVRIIDSAVEFVG
jgi:hypothetical protein